MKRQSQKGDTQGKRSGYYYYRDKNGNEYYEYYGTQKDFFDEFFKKQQEAFKERNQRQQNKQYGGFNFDDFFR